MSTEQLGSFEDLKIGRRANHLCPTLQPMKLRKLPSIGVCRQIGYICSSQSCVWLLIDIEYWAVNKRIHICVAGR
jgi:hypothetical protein